MAVEAAQHERHCGQAAGRELGEAVAIALVGSIETVKEWDTKAAAAARKLEVGLLARVMGAERH